MKSKPRLNALFTALALLALPTLTLAQSDATLASLVPSPTMSFTPAFASGTFSYTASVGNATNSMTLTPTATDSVNLPTITVNGIPVASGAASGSISLSPGGNVITTVVVSQDLTTTNTYTLTVTRAGLTYYWDTDGTTAGFGNNAGTWGSSAFWTTNASGGASTVFTITTTANDLVNFGTATVAMGSTAASVTLSGTVEAGRITFGAAQSNAPVVLAGGTIRLGGATVAVPHISPNGPSNYTATINSAIVLNTNVQVNGPNLSVGTTPGRLNLNGVISGPFDVTFFGPNGNNSYPTVVLGAQNTYTGGTRLNCTVTGANIEVKLGTNDALPTTTVLTLDGPNGSGTATGRYVRLDLNGFNQALAGLTTVVRGSRRDQGIIKSSATPATLTVNNTADYIFTGQLGSGGQNALSAPNFGLTKNGVGKLTLDPQNLSGAPAVLNLLYTGPTTIDNGILEIANNGQLGNGNYATNISIVIGAGLVFSGTRTNTLSGVISGNGSLTNSGTGTVTIAGTDAVASTVVQNGGVIAIAGGKVRSRTVDASTVSLPGAGAGTVTNLTFANTGTMNFNLASGGALVCPVANGITNMGGPGSITINITGGTPASGTYTLISYTGSLQGSGYGAYALGSTPPGTYTLTNTPGAVKVIVVSPVLVWKGAQSSEWSTQIITPLKNWALTGSPIDYSDGSPVLFDDTTSSNLVDISVADVAPNSVDFNNNTKNYALQGAYAISGGTSLTKSGTNALTVLNNNSYFGNTIINAGVLKVGNGGINGALGSGDIDNYGALEFNRSDDVAVSQNITGTGTLTKKGTNALIIATASTYSGATTVSNGTLIISGSALSSGARDYSIASGAVLNLDSSSPAFGTSTISGSGKLLITGQVKNSIATGRFLNIALASSGLIEVPLGATLVNGNFSSLLWANNLAPMSLEGNFELVNGNGVFLDALNGSGTIDNPPFGNGNAFTVNLTVGVAGGSGTFNGPIMNSTATTKILLTKTGAGTQTFTGSLDYRGATTVNAGTLALSGLGSINISPTINVVSNATLNVTGRSDGTLTVNPNQTLMGGGTVLGLVNNLGTLAPGASIGTLTISSNLVLDAASTNTFEVNGSTPANGVVQLGAGVTYGGILQIVPSGTFTHGQTFTLFKGAGAINGGNFASLTGSPGSGKAFSFTNGVLSVVSTGPSGPATLTNSVSGGVLSLAWPAGQGWRLQSQTNALTVGLGTNWVEAANSSVSSTNITVNPAQPTVFYRLTYP